MRGEAQGEDKKGKDGGDEILPPSSNRG